MWAVAADRATVPYEAVGARPVRRSASWWVLMVDAMQAVVQFGDVVDIDDVAGSCLKSEVAVRQEVHG